MSGLRAIVEQAGPPPGEGVLQHSGGPWNTAAGVAGALGESVRTALRHLETAHKDCRREAGDLESVAALGAVRASWERRLGDVRAECASLQRALHAVAPLHAGNEGAVKSSFDGMTGGRTR